MSHRPAHIRHDLHVPIPRPLIAAVAALLVAGGCSDDGETADPATFCDTVLEIETTFGADPFEALKGRDPAEVEAQMTEVVDAYDRLEAVAPEDIDEDVVRIAIAVDEVVDVLDRHGWDVDAAAADLQTTSLGEPDDLAAARSSSEAVSAYLDEHCESPVIQPPPPEPTTTTQPLD